MKNKIRLTESDLIKLVRRVIKEIEMYEPEPVKTLVRKKLNEDVVGKTVNFYYNEQETKLAGQFKIMSVIPKPNNIQLVIKPTYYLQNDKGSTWLNTFINWVGGFISNFETIFISTSCGKKEFYLQTEKNGKTFFKVLYNSKLSKDLTKEMCAKSKGKEYVPDADYNAPLP